MLRYDRQSAYTSNVQAITGNAPSTPPSSYSGPTTLVPMNLSAQRPQDTVGLYFAAASSSGSAGWSGCTLQASYDGMVSWQNVATITTESEIGRIALDEPTGGEPITVVARKSLLFQLWLGNDLSGSFTADDAVLLQCWNGSPGVDPSAQRC